MGVPTSEVGYTSAMPRRGDQEVHKDMWRNWEERKKRKKRKREFQDASKFKRNSEGLIIPQPSHSGKLIS